MHLKHAATTRHAWNQFVRRWEGEPPEDYQRELERLVSMATEEDLGHATAVRLITNDFKPARYFTAENWRFVTDENVGTIITIERIYFKKWGKKKDKRRRKP